MFKSRLQQYRHVSKRLTICILQREFSGIFCSAGGNIAISKREFPVALHAMHEIALRLNSVGATALL